METAGDRPEPVFLICVEEAENANDGVAVTADKKAPPSEFQSPTKKMFAGSAETMLNTCNQFAVPVSGPATKLGLDKCSVTIDVSHRGTCQKRGAYQSPAKA